jgi:hypothetical protein
VPQTAYDLEPVLRAVARTTAAHLGYGTAVINLYRPASDDFHTVVVEGSDEARRLLRGQTSTADDWVDLLDARFERRGAYRIDHGAFDWTADRLTSYIPAGAPSDDPDAWHPEDALFVLLRSGAGELLGILSVDEPVDGRRPRARERSASPGSGSSASAPPVGCTTSASSASPTPCCRSRGR